MSVCILGIDPGSRCTGYGVIESDGRQHRYVASGVVRVGHLDWPERLQHIFSGISTLIEKHQPNEGAIEQVFMHRNASTALKLGQARGAAIVAMVNHSPQVAEYSARQVKRAVVGYGNASKQQVQHMVCHLLKIDTVPSEDAADALAIALCHSHARSSLLTVDGAEKYRGGRWQ